MAKRKIRPHPGALDEFLKRQNMTQTEAAAASGIDRKTLAKINRGEDVKEDTLQKLAKKLNVPSTYFEPPADDTSRREASQPDNPRFHNLMLRKVDAEGLAKVLGSRIIHWQLNVHTVDEETIPLLEQLEDAVKDFHRYLQDDLHWSKEIGLRGLLDRLKHGKRVASLFEELAKHGLTILGADYLVWDCQTDPDSEIPRTNYVSQRNVVLSVEAQPAQARRTTVWQGTLPPKFNPNSETTIITVNGQKLLPF
jgi:transcriptional regulator with XRE-family HTH domain